MVKVSFLEGEEEEGGNEVLVAARVGGYRRQSPNLPFESLLRLILHEPLSPPFGFLSFSSSPPPPPPLYHRLTHSINHSPLQSSSVCRILRMSTDCSPDSPSTTCRRRRGSSIQLLRTAHNDSCLPHKDTRELAQKRFMRWTACFGFVAKLKKSKHKLELPSLPESMIRRHSSAVTQSDRSCSTATTPSSRQSPARPMSQLVERYDQDSSSLGIIHDNI